jgi:hypothetical protein
MCREIPTVLVLTMHKQQVLTIFAFQKDKPHKLVPFSQNI